MIHWEPRGWRYCQACSTAPTGGYQSVGGRDMFLQGLDNDTREAEQRAMGCRRRTFMKSKMLLWPNQGGAPISPCWSIVFGCSANYFHSFCVLEPQRDTACRGRGAVVTTESRHHVPSVSSLDSHMLSFLFWSQELLHRHPSRHSAVFGSPYWRSWTSDQWFHSNYRLE